jgi:hypothetical protein
MRHRRLLLLFSLLTLPLVGCRTWQPAQAPPETLLLRDPPERVRVTRADGVQLVLERPELRAGAIVATAAPGAVMMQDVRVLEVRSVSVGRTAAFLLPGAILIAVIGKLSCRC